MDVCREEYSISRVINPFSAWKLKAIQVPTLYPQSASFDQLIVYEKDIHLPMACLLHGKFQDGKTFDSEYEFST